MKQLFVACLFVLPAMATEPHPDAKPNTHAPGPVDFPENVAYIVEDPTFLEGIVLNETEAELTGA